MYVALKPALALIAGAVSLLSPKLARVAVGAYLVAIGVLGFLGR
jgi:hypothetical protein